MKYHHRSIENNNNTYIPTNQLKQSVIFVIFASGFLFKNKTDTD